MELFMNKDIETINQIETILKDLKSSSIFLREEKQLLMRIEANIAELKFLLCENEAMRK